MSALLLITVDRDHCSRHRCPCSSKSTTVDRSADRWRSISISEKHSSS